MDARTREYLKPSKAVRPPVPSPAVLQTTRRSLGERRLARYSQGSSHGALVVDGREVDFESRGERNAILVLHNHPMTRRLIEQSPTVRYVDADGKRHVHVFDVRLERTDGTVLAIDVKPADRIAEVQALHRLIAPQMPRSLADGLLAISERSYTSDELFNAELAWAMRRQNFPEDDALVRRLASRMRGRARVGDLVERLGRGAYGFGAVVRAIADGLLVPVEHGRLTYDTLVARAAG